MGFYIVYDERDEKNNEDKINDINLAGFLSLLQRYLNQGDFNNQMS